jgi:ABC-2 type transport system ATP-binding protein
MISDDIVSVSISGSYTGISLPGIRFVGMEGDYLIFHTKNGSQALPLIKDELTAQGMQVLEMSVRSPSLDDVFLHLVGPGEDTSPFKLSAFRNMTGKRK